MTYYGRVGNFAAVGWCSAGVGLLGLIFMIAGAVITGIAYTEITPPNYDENYNRYLGASVPRLVGPFLLCFGAILLFGSCAFFGLAFYNANRDFDSNGSRSYEYTAARTTGVDTSKA
ncbi:uncharacterized protein LOC128965339 [Oppia nitens]|uniref:uncharacterized protein LOC128965339 n=1 Tax=Oppia nitens TaxID=1686743 RepID=UPI0023D9F312|nr:uncharacterized protein LOC128965339 [Oppia nitens]XP_054167985.1 uncharacterized protein LOC128965339 [Oppia nitens]XP_054167986.1 uncharacterized protein LOC128965339 [Oppia nitens]XP_054167987.1 uncharacterized protein LOC128965339 [Oppia nitens]XP_054167988.1 uncharacterized protein LOC128965339 [Oppia nitens]